ncbi:hypothetical protein M139_2510, partial [Bacteroides fragilis str. S23L24]
MATAKIYLDTRREKKDGQYPIKITIRHKGKFLLSTGFDTILNNWNGSEYTNKEPNYKAKNASIRNIISKIENEIFRLDMDGKLNSTSDQALKSLLEKCLPKSSPEKVKRFVDYMNDFMELKEKEGTKKVYVATRNRLLRYDPDCTFETMDVAWLMRFEKWMKEEGLKVNAVGINMRSIRAVFNYAIDEEITSLYPFRKYKIKKEETPKRSLSAEQVVLLRDYACESHQERYRDMFILMIYLIGINGIDLFSLKGVVDGRIEYHRAKTGKFYSIKLEPEAIEIIERYKGQDWLLNVLDTYRNYADFLHRMDVGLKQIGPVIRKGLGGKKERSPLFPEISSYWA